MNVLLVSYGATDVDTPYYYYTLKYPAPGIKYIYDTSRTDVSLNSTHTHVIKTTAGQLIRYAKTALIQNNLCVSKLKPIKNLNNNLFFKNKIDLVHALNFVPKTDMPFIVEFETHSSPFIGNPTGMHQGEHFKDHLLKENCHSIIFWTKTGMENFKKIVPDEKIHNKCVVLEPGVDRHKRNKYYQRKTFGFVARNFLDKGGELALRVMDEYTKATGNNAVIVSETRNIPSACLAIIDNNPNITLRNLMPRKELNKEIMSKIDILVYPGFSDSFGYIFPEAYSFGIPVITIQGYSRSDIVGEKNGYICGGHLGKYGNLVDMTEKEEEAAALAILFAMGDLCSSEKKWEDMSKFNHREVSSGRFNPKLRADKLKQIYKRALI